MVIYLFASLYGMWLTILMIALLNQNVKKKSSKKTVDKLVLVLSAFFAATLYQGALLYASLTIQKNYFV